MKLRLFKSLFLALAFATSSLSFAADEDYGGIDPIAPLKPSLPGQKDQYQTCDQACLYEKANENLSMQALYIVNRQSILLSYSEDNASQDKKDHVVADLTPLFCGAKDDTAKDCANRYVLYSLPVLQHIKEAMAANSESERRLATGQEATPAIIKVDNGTLKLPQTPFVADWKYMKGAMAAQAKTAAIKPESYGTWFGEHKIFNPRPEDFVKFNVVPRDPARKEAGSFLVAAGPDSDKFNKARTLYEQEKKVRDRIMGYMDPKNGGHSTLVKAASVPLENSIDYDAYMNAEKSFVGAANSVLHRPDFNRPSAQQTGSTDKPKTPPANSTALRTEHAGSNPTAYHFQATPPNHERTPATNPAPKPPSDPSHNQADAHENTDAYPTTNDPEHDYKRAPAQRVSDDEHRSLTVEFDPKQIDQEISNTLDHMEQ